MRFKILIIIFFTLSACKPTIKNDNPIVAESQYGVEVIKFMGSITTFPHSIGEREFWENSQEHADLKIINDDFISNVLKLSDKSIDGFREYKYAFLVKTENSTDTLYCDPDLERWILKRSGSYSYYYDKEGVIAQRLRLSYSFFYDCW